MGAKLTQELRGGKNLCYGKPVNVLKGSEFLSGRDGEIELTTTGIPSSGGWRLPLRGDDCARTAAPTPTRGPRARLPASSSFAPRGSRTPYRPSDGRHSRSACAGARQY